MEAAIHYEGGGHLWAQSDGGWRIHLLLITPSWATVFHSADGALWQLPSNHSLKMVHSNCNPVEDPVVEEMFSKI